MRILIVHRALIGALKLGDDGLRQEDEARLHEIAEQITQCERRSMAAERDATSRYIASFLADRVGSVFEGRVTGVTRFGLFIRLDETQADGLAPISSLGAERWHHDEAAHALVGEASGKRFQLGQRVEVKLEEATPVSGGLLFSLESDPLRRYRIGGAVRNAAAAISGLAHRAISNAQDRRAMMRRAAVRVRGKRTRKRSAETRAALVHHFSLSGRAERDPEPSDRNV